jgi:signal transduction histidine kinase
VGSTPLVEPSDQDVAWTVLTADSEDARPDRPLSWRRIVIQAVLAVLVVFSVVAVAGTIAARRAAESESVNDALQVTDLLAGAVVIPALEDAILSSDPATAAAAVDRLDHVVRKGVMVGPIVRVKLWAPDGRIVYSDETRLIGERFALGEDEREVLRSPSTRADISDLRGVENRFERAQGKLLEVYRPVWTPSGLPLLFETYSHYETVTARSAQLTRGFGGITISSLLLVLVLQAPLTWALVGRVRRAQRQREVLLDRAVSASEEERRRIAATLHDGAVQDLTASAFAVAGVADRARSAGQESLAERLDAVAGTVRASIGGLRSLLVDIYPPSLRKSGLAAALGDLVTTLRSRDVDVRLSVPSRLELPPQVEEVVFRVAQECLRNAARHANAERVTVSVEATDRAARLDVADDGVGFDPGSALADPSEGHFGLRVLADLAKDANAVLSVSSAPAKGTRWRLEVPLP